MRLTLRTLLAYLDGILDPSDARDLERKIAESELASRLIERIRTLQADRDAATARVGGADANDVANYLDNTMPPQRVSDFERICLDSDAHLAEVTACHQILTRVLSEEMKTPAALRRRLIQLPHATASQAPANPSDAAPHTTAARVSRDALRFDQGARAAHKAAPEARDGWDADEHWTTAPDYLKQSRKRTWKSLATLAAISLCLLVAALRGMGPFNQDHPLAHYVEPLARRWSGSAPRGPEVAAVPESSATPEPRSAARRDTTEAPIETSSPDRSPTPQPPDRVPGDDGTHGIEVGDNADPAIAATEVPAIPEGIATSDDERRLDTADPDSASSDSASSDSASSDSASSDTKATPEATDETTSTEADGGLMNPLAEVSPAAADATAKDTDTESAGDTPAVSATGDASSGDASSDPATEAAGTEGAAPAEAVATGDGGPGMELINPLEDAGTDGDAPRKPAPGIAAPEKVTDAGALGAADGQPIHLKPKPVDLAAVDLGRFLNDQQVLLHGQSSDATWQRLAPGDRLQVGQQLLSLPTFRPPILLESGLQVSLIGATRLEVLPPSDEAMPRFGLHFGRLAVAAFTSEGSKFGLQWGAEQNGSLTLDEMTSVAVELTRRYLPGDNPETSETPPYEVLMLYVTSGSAIWERAGAEPLTLPAGTRLVQVNDREPLVSAFSNTPAWIDGRDARPRDPIAAQDLGTRVTLDRPATQTLRELASDRRLEVRSLAACSLAYTGDLDPLLDALGDAKLRSYWPVQYEVLLHRMNLGPDSVHEVRDALRRRHGNEDGEALYRMLLGFSPQQLAEGGADKLVEYLDHPLTEFRFAANETLRAITGLPTLYQAHANERQRRPAVAKWRTHLQQNKIAYVEPPELVRFLNTEVAPTR